MTNFINNRLVRMSLWWTLSLQVLMACKAVCPAGRVKEGDLCVPAPGTAQEGTESAEGAQSAEPDGSVASAGPGNDGGTATSSTSVSMMTGSAGGHADDAASTPTQNQAGSGASGGPDVAGSSAPASSPSEPSVTANADVCAGHMNESVCDGAVLHNCGAATSETCMTPALCETGKSSGVCAACTPGTFHCEGAELSSCGADGQYSPLETCSSAALCKEDAGQCTDAVCNPNEKTCSSDGSSLRTCNADGSAIADELSCEGKGCNQAQKVCNTCVPGQSSCSGTDLATCAADGQTMTMMPCRATGGECSTATCSGNACRTGFKERGAACSSGGSMCDGNGQCVSCLTASDCGSPGPCATATCTNGQCDMAPRPRGTACMGSNMECDGSGMCVEKPCGNGRVDPNEQCDYMDAAWRGNCSMDCKVAASIFQKCNWRPGDCAGEAHGWYCSSVGLCGRNCTSAADCPAGSSCRPVTDGNSTCVWDCSGVGFAGCPGGARCQWYGKKDETPPSPSSYQTCGWQSADPTNGNARWCMHEYTDVDPVTMQPGPGCCFQPGINCVPTP